MTKTYGCIHLTRGGRTACGRVFNRGTMIGCNNTLEVSCTKCIATRYWHIQHGVEHKPKPRKARPRRTPRTALPEAPTYCVFCKRDHVGGSTCMGHYP